MREEGEEEVVLVYTCMWSRATSKEVLFNCLAFGSGMVTVTQRESVCV